MDINLIAGGVASAVVGAMATDAWSYVRTRAARLLARGGDPAEENVALTELDELQTSLSESSPSERHQTAREVEAELRSLLRNRLRHDPTFAAEFQALADEIAEQLKGNESKGNVTQFGKSEGSSTFYQIGGDMHGSAR